MLKALESIRIVQRFDTAKLINFHFNSIIILEIFV